MANFATALPFPNPYVLQIVNNLDLIITLNRKKKDWTKKYYKIIQGLETMVDIQMQIQDLVKLADVVNNQLANIKIILLQAEEMYKMQIGRNIYSISEKL